MQPALPKLALHHVGGRWGSQPFPSLSCFRDDFINVLYDADEDAIAGMRRALKEHPSEVIILPACLSEVDGEASLQLYLNPGFNSLRRLTRALHLRYLHLFGVDFDFGDAGARLLDGRVVKTQRLDTVIREQDGKVPSPDFLSIDVQGTEYEVLSGARHALEQHILGLVVEVEFAEMYQGQKRFQEITDLLTQAGFDFVRFVSLGESSGPPTPLGFRGGGYQDWADALFLRRLNSLPNAPERRWEMLTKLAFISIAFGNIELAVQAIDLRGALRPRDPASGELRTYGTFIAAFAEIYERSKKVWPPVFSKILPSHRIGDFLSSGTAEEWPAIFEGLRAFDAAYLSALAAMEAEADTEFEALLRRYGFVEQANRVNQIRRQQARNIRHAIRASAGDQVDIRDDRP